MSSQMMKTSKFLIIRDHLNKADLTPASSLMNTQTITISKVMEEEMAEDSMMITLEEEEDTRDTLRRKITPMKAI